MDEGEEEDEEDEVAAELAAEEPEVEAIDKGGTREGSGEDSPAAVSTDFSSKVKGCTLAK